LEEYSGYKIIQTARKAGILCALPHIQEQKRVKKWWFSATAIGGFKPTNKQLISNSPRESQLEDSHGIADLASYIKLTAVLLAETRGA